MIVCRRRMNGPPTTYRLVPPERRRCVPTLDDAPAARSSTTRAGRCWCWPGRAPARPRPWSRRSSTGSSAAPPRRGARADVLPQGRRAAARPGDRAARPDDGDGAELDVPLLRLRADPPLLADRALRGAAAAAVRAGAGRRAARAARRSPGVGALARDAAAARSAPAGSPARSTRCSRRAREKGLDGAELRELGEARGAARVGRGRPLPRPVPHQPRLPGRHRLRRPDPARGDRGRAPPRRAAARGPTTSSSTSTRTPTPARSRCSGRSPATAATSPSSATRTSRSTASAAPRCAASSTSRPSSRAPTGEPADVVALGRPAGSGRGCWSLPAGGRPAGPARARSPRTARAAFPDPVAEAGALGEGRVEVRTFDTERAEAEHLADLLRRAHLEDGVPWRRDGGAGAFRPDVDPAAAPRPRRRRACRSRWPATRCRWSATRRCCRCSTRCGRWSTSTTTTSSTSTTSTRPGRGAAARPARRPGRRRVRRLPGCCGPREGAGRGRGATAAPSRELVRAGGRRPGLPRRARRPRGRPRPRARPAAPRRARDSSRPAHRPRRCCGRCGRAPSWPPRLRRSVDLGGGAARRAHRDLDAICARSSRWRPAPRSSATTSACASFLDTLVAQQIPADTLAERGARGAAVRLLTAHRSKGLEWRLVVVAHVQQEGWPDLRRRSTLLQADRIGARRRWCRR